MNMETETGLLVKQQSSRAQCIIYMITAVISVLGLAETTYLTALHLAGAHVVCVAAATCSQVLGSAYATIAGIPLAGVGAAGYFAAFSLATLAAFGSRRAAMLLALIITAMFLTTFWLLYLQAFVLHAFCDYCLFSAALIFLLAGLCIATPPQRRN